MTLCVYCRLKIKYPVMADIPSKGAADPIFTKRSAWCRCPQPGAAEPTFIQCFTQQGAADPTFTQCYAGRSDGVTAS